MSKKVQSYRNILKEIVERTREDLAKRKKKRPFQVEFSISHSGGRLRRPIESHKKKILSLRSRMTGKDKLFRDAILSPKKGVALIAEIKLASPSEGNLGSFEEVLERAKAYEKAGADAISVVVEKHFFKGDISFIPKIKEVVRVPILMKDFIIDEYQIAEAKEAGVDAVLLIVRIVDERKLKDLVRYCVKTGIESVVEIDNANDIKKAIDSKPRIIAVNARDLDTFEVNVNRACGIIKKIPNEYIKLGFSGINSNIEVYRYQKAGAKGVLVGASLMKSKDPKSLIESLRSLSHS